MLVTRNWLLHGASGIAQRFQEQDQQLCVQLGQDVGCQGHTQECLIMHCFSAVYWCIGGLFRATLYRAIRQCSSSMPMQGFELRTRCCNVGKDSRYTSAVHHKNIWCSWVHSAQSGHRDWKHWPKSFGGRRWDAYYSNVLCFHFFQTCPMSMWYGRASAQVSPAARFSIRWSIRLKEILRRSLGLPKSHEAFKP